MIIQTKEDVVDFVNTVGTTLDQNLIRIWQKDRKFQQVQGILTMKYVKSVGEDDAIYGGEEGDGHNFDPEVVSGQVTFLRDPFNNAAPQGSTGLVFYLLDDNEPTPERSLSGAERGYNREWLASMYAEDKLIIDDKKVLADVKKRHKAIIAKLPEQIRPRTTKEMMDEKGMAEQPMFTQEEVDKKVLEETNKALADHLGQTKQIEDKKKGKTEAPKPETQNIENAEMKGAIVDS